MKPWAVAGIALLGCAFEPEPARNDMPLTSGQVARVGRSTLELHAVQTLAAERSLSVRTALAALVREALLAEHLRLEAPALASYLERITLARRLSENFMHEARAAGPPSDDEVDEYTQRHWWQLDRPAAARVAHAVVVCQECRDREGARALAERIRAAVVGETDAARFLDAARAVERAGFVVKAEHLAPVAADGRVVRLDARPDPDFSFGRFHVEFAQAANAIAQVGEQSPVVQSPSGFHVLLLTERVSEQRTPLEERRQILADEIVAGRGARIQDQVLARAREQWSTDVMRSFEEMTGRLLVDSLDP